MLSWLFSWLSDNLTDVLTLVLLFFQYRLLRKQCDLSKVMTAAAMDGSLKKVDRYLEAVEKQNRESAVPWLGCLFVLAVLVSVGVWVWSFFK